MQLAEDIPQNDQPIVAAAVEWYNKTYDATFEVTGLVDSDLVSTDGPFELGLVLCDGELCAREQVVVTPSDDGFQFRLAAEAVPDIPPLLDPPEGNRKQWFEQQLQKFEFVLLLYYRGLW